MYLNLVPVFVVIVAAVILLIARSLWRRHRNVWHRVVIVLATFAVESVLVGMLLRSSDLVVTSPSLPGASHVQPEAETAPRMIPARSHPHSDELNCENLSDAGRKAAGCP